MKKILLLVLLLAFMYSPVKATIAPPAYLMFSDVPESYIYIDAIEYVLGQDIVSGYSDGTFKPDNAVTRGEFTKIIIGSLCGKLTDFRFENSECGLSFGVQGGGYIPLPDVDGCSEGPGWEECSNVATYGEKLFVDGIYVRKDFGPYIYEAKKRNIISGYSDGTFKPDVNITFDQAAKIVANSFGFLEDDKSKPYPDNRLHRYVSELSDRDAIPMEIQSRDSYITRGQMVEIIYRLKNNITNKPSNHELIFN